MQRAEEVAIAALSYIASNPDLLQRFLDLTGLDPSSLRGAAADAGFLPSVLDFFLAHEPTLIAFADHAQIEPAHVVAARAAFGRQSTE